MPTSAAKAFSLKKLEPLFNQEDALMINVALATGTYALGTVLGEQSASRGTYGAYSSTKVAAPSGAPVLTPSTTGGALVGGTGAPGNYTVAYAYKNANGSTVIGPSATANVASGATGSIAVTAVTPLPTNVTSVDWYMSASPGSSVLIFQSNNNGSAFTITALPAAGGAVPPTVSTAVALSDGTGIAKAVLVYDVIVDGSGNVTYSATGGQVGDDMGLTSKYTSVYISGVFACEDLTGLDATAVSQLGRLVNGSTTAGIIELLG